jgi:hypothetical protein
MDPLDNNQVEILSGKGVLIGKYPANRGKSLSTKGWVIPLDTNRLVKVKKN